MKSVNIDKIIRESIENFIQTTALNENVSYLNTYKVQLNNYLNIMSNDFSKTNMQSIDRRLFQYIRNFETYVIQVIHALTRCIKAGTLNESLSDWGLNVPHELRTNFWNGARRGYYATRNFFYRNGANYGMAGKNEKMKNRNGNNSYSVNPNMVKSVKLSILLDNIQRQEDEFNVQNVRFGINNITTAPNKIFKTLYSLKSAFDQMQNANNNNNNNNNI